MTTGPGTDNLLSVPGAYSYADSFSAPTNNVLPNGNFGFYDDYLFTLTQASIESVTTTLDLNGFQQIDNMQARVYLVGGASGNSAPTLGNPTGPVYYATWSTQSFDGGAVTVETGLISDAALAAGNYVLEISGQVSGADGGNYSGLLSPVPLPAALPLLASGLALLGGFIRRRPAMAATAAAC